MMKPLYIFKPNTNKKAQENELTNISLSFNQIYNLLLKIPLLNL